MTLNPLVLEVIKIGGRQTVKASTSLDRAVRDAQMLQTELRCIELDYQTTLAAAKEALALGESQKLRDPRVYWYAGKYIADFLARMEAAGFFVVGKNTTPATHLNISRASIQKMMHFYRRYPNPLKIDSSVSWSVYRDNKEKIRKSPRI